MESGKKRLSRSGSRYRSAMADKQAMNKLIKKAYNVKHYKKKLATEVLVGQGSPISPTTTPTEIRNLPPVASPVGVSTPLKGWTFAASSPARSSFRNSSDVSHASLDFLAQYAAREVKTDIALIETIQRMADRRDERQKSIFQRFDQLHKIGEYAPSTTD